MNLKIYTKLQYLLITACLAIGCFLLWCVGYPEYLSYQEQYQLFLFTPDYLVDRIFEIGGVADYIAEFLTQLYYVPWIGALSVTLVIVVLQITIAALAIRSSGDQSMRTVYYALSIAPSVMILHYMGDENLLLSFPVALTIVLLSVYVVSCCRTKGVIVNACLVGIGFAVVYWISGPLAFLYALLSPVFIAGVRKRVVWVVASVLFSILVVFIVHRVFYDQYPLSELLLGINYHRVSFMHPGYMYVIVAVVIGVIMLPKLHIEMAEVSPAATYAIIAAIMIASPLYVLCGIDEDKMEHFAYDRMVRAEAWQQIIDKADRDAPKYDFCLQAVNLALAKTGQLGERMFEYPQSGIGSLLSPYVVDNTTCLITTEAFYHLGMINSAFRHNFDLQEAIMNDRLSGRFLKRMAECQIINGKYASAEKYLNKLKHSLFYRKWAQEAETYLYDEQKINQHPEWGMHRRMRIHKELLYNYEAIERVLGMVAVDSRGQNEMAWQYFNAANLLKCNVSGFAGMYHYGPELFGVEVLPKHHQEAFAMTWAFWHDNYDDLPYPVGDKYKAMMTSILQTLMIDRSTVGEKYAGTYPAYYLARQKEQRVTPQNISGTQRGE